MPEESPKLVAQPVFWEDESEEISLIRLASALLRHRRVIAALPLLGLVLFTGIGLVLPRSYTTTSSILPQTTDQSSAQLAGVAAQLGFTLPTSDGGQSPQFYADLLQTRELLRRAVQQEYVFRTDPEDPGSTRTASLVEVYRARGDDDAERSDEAADELVENMDVKTRGETGVVEISVRTRWAELSRAVSQQLLDLVEEFNLETRRSRASAERAFVEGRLQEIQNDLAQAEDSLEAFLRANRRYNNSPELRFTFDRLNRRVALYQQLYTTLSESYEQAKIEEVRDTPVFTVVEPPVVPARADSRRLLARGAVGLSLGLLVGIVWAFFHEFLTLARQRDPDEFREYHELRRATREDLRRLFAGLRRIFRRVRPQEP